MSPPGQSPSLFQAAGASPSGLQAAGVRMSDFEAALIQEVRLAGPATLRNSALDRAPPPQIYFWKQKYTELARSTPFKMGAAVCARRESWKALHVP